MLYDIFISYKSYKANWISRLQYKIQSAGKSPSESGLNSRKLYEQVPIERCRNDWWKLMTTISNQWTYYCKKYNGNICLYYINRVIPGAEAGIKSHHLPGYPGAVQNFVMEKLKQHFAILDNRTIDYRRTNVWQSKFIISDISQLNKGVK